MFKLRKFTIFRKKKVILLIYSYISLRLIKASEQVTNLGVILDADLIFWKLHDKYYYKIFYHLRNILSFILQTDREISSRIHYKQTRLLSCPFYFYKMYNRKTAAYMELCS